MILHFLVCQITGGHVGAERRAGAALGRVYPEKLEGMR